MLGALSAAHKAGVMHRDVKPGNVLIGDDGRVVLTDFGLATVPGDPNVTRTGLVLGSPAYIAPERARDGSAGPEADLWSLGATIYAAVEGQSPYARPSAIGTLTALATEPPPPLKNGGPLKPVINGLLQKNPAERMKADAAERLLRKVVGRKARTGISLLDMRRQSSDAPRPPRVAAVPAPRAAQEQPRPAPPATEGAAATAKVDAPATAKIDAPSATPAAANTDAPGATADATRSAGRTAAGGRPPARRGPTAPGPTREPSLHRLPERPGGWTGRTLRRESDRRCHRAPDEPPSCRRSRTGRRRTANWR